MLALSILMAVSPCLLCFACSAYMVMKEKAQWKYFAVFAFVSGFGGIFMLDLIGVWRLALRG